MATTERMARSQRRSRFTRSFSLNPLTPASAGFVSQIALTLGAGAFRFEETADRFLAIKLDGRSLEFTRAGTMRHTDRGVRAGDFFPSHVNSLGATATLV